MGVGVTHIMGVVKECSMGNFCLAECAGKEWQFSAKGENSGEMLLG